MEAQINSVEGFCSFYSGVWSVVASRRLSTKQEGHEAGTAGYSKELNQQETVVSGQLSAKIYFNLIVVWNETYGRIRESLNEDWDVRIPDAGIPLVAAPMEGLSCTRIMCLQLSHSEALPCISIDVSRLDVT